MGRSRYTVAHWAIILDWELLFEFSFPKSPSLLGYVFLVRSLDPFRITVVRRVTSYLADGRVVSAIALSYEGKRIAMLRKGEIFEHRR